MTDRQTSSTDAPVPHPQDEATPDRIHETGAGAPRRVHVQTDQCRKVSRVLARVGDKWSVLVVMLLAEGPCRFNELRRMIDGISQRMLTLTLRGLERDGLVSRSVTPSIPPRVDYELTALGRSLTGPVMSLGQWALTHTEAIDAAQAQFDARCTEAGKGKLR